jgi:hypothetical protein
VAEGLDPTIDAEADPTEDTQPEPDDDTGENTQQDAAPDGYVEASRYAALQAEFTRKSQRLKAAEDQLLDYRAQPQDEAATEAALPPDIQRELATVRQMRQQMEWDRAIAEYGEPARDAYAEFQRGFELAMRPDGSVDPVRLLGAYRDSIDRYGTLTQPEQPRKPRTTPRVDPNRSDAPDQNALDKQIEDAKAGKGKGRLDPLGSYLDAKLKKAGLV